MKEEEITEKLKSIPLPDIKTERHQSRLRMALLESDYLKMREQDSLRTKIKGVMTVMKDTVKRGLLAEQPIWKTASISIGALAVVILLVLTMPFTPKSVYAETEEIAREASSVKEALGGGEIEIIRIDISEEIGTVVAKGPKGTVLAEVDLNIGQVSSVAEFTVDEEAAVEIAMADPRVKELIDAGAVIDGVSTMYISGVTGSYLTGEEEESYEALVLIEINDGEKVYVAQVRYPDAQVTGFYETLPVGKISVPSPVSESSFIEDTQTNE